MKKSPSNLSRWKTWLAILVLIGMGFYLYSLEVPKDKGSSPENVSTESVGTGSSLYSPSSRSRKKVSALGRLEPKGEIIDLASSENDRVAKLLVKEGDKVKKGQELVHMELYSERLAGIGKLSAEIQEARALLEAETQFGLNQINEREVRLDRLEQILPLQIDTQEAEIRKLEAELENAKVELDRLEQLKARATVSQQQLDRQALSVVTITEQLTAANVRLEELNKSLELDIRLARSELHTAQAELVKLQTAIQIDSLEKELKVARARFERTVIRAPRNGEILEIISWEGEMVDSEPILKLGNTRQMYVVAEVYESDVQWVKIGQKATVTSPAFSEPISGTVDFIGRLIAKNDVLDVDPASDTDSRVVEVKILLGESKTISGLSNLQVDVEINVES